MEAPERNQEGAVGSTNDVVTPNTPGAENHDSEVMYYMDEPQTGKSNKRILAIQWTMYSFINISNMR